MRNKNPGIHRSTAVPNVAYKRSWCEFFHKLSMEAQGRKTRRMTGRPVENDVTVEILKDRIPTVTCKSLRKRRSGFRTFSTGPATIHYCLTRRETLMTRAKMRFLFDRSHPLRK